MKKSGFFLSLTFVTYLIGQFFWTLTFFLEEPLWGNAFYEELFLIQIYNSTGVLGLISGFLLYRGEK